jgi:asparagine synthase (glutamine-hydrolysing)
MCGIVGRFSWRGPVDPGDELLGAVDLLRHRGPDEGAWWRDERFFFGHRRLSIIDLSTGQQPMGTSDGSLVITFNGEIYNHSELRDELAGRGHAFRTRSDTEVLLEGYRAWGEEMLPRLIGQFAFAIADRASGELFLARDAFGEKPLFYREEAGAVTFASELRPLAALPGERRLDEWALGQFLCLNYVPGEATLLAGVRRVPPASWRRYAASGVATGRYWEPRPRPHAPSADAARDELRHHLDRAVRHALVSDVPVGVFLSGGMDSSLVAESAARQGRLSQAYCLDFPEAGFSEWPQAELVARRLGLPLARVRMGPEVAADFFRMVEHADDPLADSSALAVWTISREAARGNKVVLGGDGGDELFAGYLTYPASLVHASVVARLPRPLREAMATVAWRLPVGEGKVAPSYRAMRFLRAANRPTREAHFTWNGTWLPEAAAGLLRGEIAPAAARATLRELAERHRLTEPPRLTDLQSADIGDYLPNDILAKVDRMSMAHGLEVRAPFLQTALAEFALSLPDHLRCRRTGRPKRLLRELARTVFGGAIADRKKQGFSIPIHGWLRGPLRAAADELLAPEALRAIDALDAAAVRRAWADHLSGRRALGWEVFGLMVVSAWHRARVASRPQLVPSDRLVRREITRRAAAPLAQAREG